MVNRKYLIQSWLLHNYSGNNVIEVILGDWEHISVFEFSCKKLEKDIHSYWIGGERSIDVPYLFKNLSYDFATPCLCERADISIFWGGKPRTQDLIKCRITWTNNTIQNCLSHKLLVTLFEASLFWKWHKVFLFVQYLLYHCFLFTMVTSWFLTLWTHCFWPYVICTV